MDYETFGIHKNKETGIFDFLLVLPGTVLTDPDFIFSVPSEILKTNHPEDIYDVPQTISLESKSDLNIAWQKNVMQNNTLTH